MAYAEAQIELSQRLPDGATLRDHLIAAKQQDDERIAKRIPHLASHLWTCYVELSAYRPRGMGASAIPPSEILTWCQLHRVSLSGWEVGTLQAMDRAALAKHHELKAAKT